MKQFVRQGFDKQEAIRQWVLHHHPHLHVKCTGYVVIGDDLTLLDKLGTINAPDRPYRVVEINFDVNDDGHDWFFNHNVGRGQRLAQLEASIFDSSYFDQLETMLKLAGL